MSTTTRPINFAVLGPHGRGRMTLQMHRPDEGLFIRSICAANLENLDNFRLACGKELAMTTDYRKIMADPAIDAVFVCTPDSFHAEHAIAALRAGKHVFLEKPMAITIADCDAILAAAKISCAKLYIGHNMRYFPVMKKMKELIMQGRIGRVEAIWCRHFISYGGDAYFKDWHSDRKNITSLLLQKGAHDIDIIHWLAGGFTKRVVGMGKLSVYNEVTDRRHPSEPEGTTFNQLSNPPRTWPPLSQTGLSPVIDIEDHNMIMMQLDNGVQASYTECHYSPDDWRDYTVIGTEGRIENYGTASGPEKWASVHLWNRRMGYQEQGNEVFRIPYVEGGHGGSDPSMLDDFVNVIRDGTTHGANPWDARMAVAVGYLGAKSLRNGSVPFDIPV